jgi:hypothetical protein
VPIAVTGFARATQLNPLRIIVSLLAALLISIGVVSILADQLEYSNTQNSKASR